MGRDSAQYTCGECGGPVDKDAGRCPHCGVLLSGTKRTKGEICKKCGWRTKGTDYTCPHCGHTRWGMIVFLGAFSLACLMAGLYPFVSDVELGWVRYACWGIGGLFGVGGLGATLSEVITAAKAHKRSCRTTLIIFGLALCLPLIYVVARPHITSLLSSRSGPTASATAVTAAPAPSAATESVTAAAAIRATEVQALTVTPRPSAKPTAALPSAVVSSDTLNVRTGPSTDYPIITTLKKGTELVVTGRNKASNWLQVELANGKTGWVWAEYTTLSTTMDKIALVSNVAKPPTPAASRTPAPPTATLTVDQQIAKVAKGEHGELGQPGESGGVDAGGQAEVTIINDTPHVLTLLIGSPSSTTITIPACPVCQEYGAVGPASCPEEGRTRTTVRLNSGTSQVVARVSDPSVIDFYGKWELKANTAYFNCFYISSTWR